MYCNFKDLPKNSRIWVYQADRTFSEQELININSNLKSFLEDWTTHGKPLKASFNIFFDQFIIIAVDESYNTASGCSIDKCSELIRILESRLGIRLMDRSLVAFRKADKIEVTSFINTAQLVSEGLITKDTTVYNNSVTTLAELETNWEIPAEKSWLSKYFNN